MNDREAGAHPMRRHRSGHAGGIARSGSRGAALTEFVVLAIVTVPLLFGIPMIGKLVDLRQTAVQASRYVVWESTVNAGDAVPGDVRERFFADRSVAIATSGARHAGSNALWGSARAGKAAGSDGGAGIAIDESSVSALPYADARSGEDGFSIAAAAGDAVHRSGSFLAGIAGSEWGLEGDGLKRGGVRVGVADNDWFAASAGVGCAPGAHACLEETSLILQDGWSAGSDEASVRRVKSLVPGNALERIGDVVAIAGKLPVFKELEGLDGAFGHVDPAPLPESETGERPSGGEAGARR